MEQEYVLRLYDTDLLSYSLSEQGIEGLKSQIHSVKEENKALFPLDLELTDDGLVKWLQRRVIPKNRAYVAEILKTFGLSINDTKGIIDVCKGLSLNDSYWVVPQGFTGTFAQYNLYENRFSEILSLVAYTGIGQSDATFTTSPELTTNGMLPKAWRFIEDEGIYLYKGGTSGFSNTGFEPYSELYAYQVARTMGVNAIPYTLTKDLKKTLCSRCELFTSKEYSYMPVGQLVKRGGMPAIRAYYATLGQEFVDALDDMIVFDAVICNTDRHYGNFGLLIDNATNRIAKPAPLFDHGNALFSLGGPDLWEDETAFRTYADSLLPVAYDSFFEEAATVMQPRHHRMLRKLLDFRFDRRATRYNLPANRLAMIEQEVRRRARWLLQ